MVAPSEVRQEETKSNAVIDGKQYENAAGFEIPQKFDAMPCVPISVSELQSHNDEGILEDDVDVVHEAEYHSGLLESKSKTISRSYRGEKTKSRSYGKEEIPSPQSHKAGISYAKHLRLSKYKGIPGIERQKEVQAAQQRFIAISQFKKLWMWWMTELGIIRLCDTAEKFLWSRGTFYELTFILLLFGKAAQKLLWSRGTFRKFIVVLLFFGKVCSASGGSETFLVNGFPPFIELNCSVPSSSQAKWLNGPRTIVENITENQNLIISLRDMKKYDCEIRGPGNRTLYQYHMQALNTCTTVEGVDFDAFKGGKKFIQVELKGKVAVSGSVGQQYYSLFIKNDMMEISTEAVSGHQPQLSSITKCNVKYENIEPNPHVNERIGPTANSVGDDVEKSKPGKGILIGAGVVLVIVICLLGTGYGITRCRRRDGNPDEEEPALNEAVIQD